MTRSFCSLSRLAVVVLFALVAASAWADEPAPKKFEGNKPEATKPAEDGSLTLPATRCEVYGKTLQYMPEDRALGWWNSEDDRAVWKLTGVKPGVYEVWFEWSCADESADEPFILAAGEKKLKGKIPTTGGWAVHKKAKFGTIELPEGDSKLELRGERKPKEALGDFREIRLTPVAKPK
jgi:hypothetical protein